MAQKICIWLFLTIVFAVSADEIVSNAAGDKILLKEDGTWIVITVRSASAVPDFRLTNWGMPYFEVKGVEKTRMIYEKQNHALGYETKILDYNCRLYYQFANRILTSTSYQIHETFADKKRYIEVYFQIQNLLREKYGKPLKDEVRWDPDTRYKKDDFSQWLLALERNQLVLRTTWKNQQTNITLTCNYEAAYSQKIALAIYYSSILLLQMTIVELPEEDEKGPPVFDEF